MYQITWIDDGGECTYVVELIEPSSEEIPSARCGYVGLVVIQEEVRGDLVNVHCSTSR